MPDMEKHRQLLIIGQLSFILGMISSLANIFFIKDNFILAFISGALFGLSVVLNLNYLQKSRLWKGNNPHS
jgi:hypothetical protein